MIALERTRGHRQQVAAGQYHDNAAAASALALAATLDRVRERHEHAAVTWNNLAALYEAMPARQAIDALSPAVDILDPARS
jgi:hypothetical protein